MFLFMLLCFQEPSLDLEGLLRLAVENHNGLQAHDHLQAGALRDAEAAAYLADPTVSLSLYAQPVETRVGPQRAALNINQAFDWPGRRTARAAIDRARAEAHASNRFLDEALLRRDLSKAWYNLYFLQRKLAVNEENLNLMEQMENVARARFRTGQSAYAFVIQAQARLVDLTEKVAAVRDDIAAMKAHISGMAGLMGAADIPTIVLEDAAPNPPGGTQALLHAMKAEMEIQSKQEALAHFDFKPSFKAGISYIQTDGARFPGVPDSGKDPIIATVSVSVPLYRKRNRAKLASVQRRLWATDAEIRQTSSELSHGAHRHEIKLRKIRRRVKLYEGALIPQARDALDAFLKAFRTGELGFASVIAAQTSLLEFQLDLERARADERIHLAELSWLVGVTVAGEEEIHD